MPVIRFKPVGVDGTGGFADIVVPTMGGSVIPGTEGAGGPVVTPGGPVDGTAGLAPAKGKIHNIFSSLPCSGFHAWNDFRNNFYMNIFIEIVDHVLFANILRLK